MSDERITTLEMKLSHLETQFEDLNGVVLEQVEMIKYLRLKLEQTESKVASIGAGGEDNTGLSPTEIAERDKPPHY